MSTSEVEYMAMSYRAREGIWIQRFINEFLSNKAVREMNMLGNNETSLTLTKDPENQNCTKHSYQCNISSRQKSGKEELVGRMDPQLNDASRWLEQGLASVLV